MVDAGTLNTLAGGATVGLAAMGAYVATRPGMIMGKVGELAERMKARGGWRAWAAKPLGGCSRCMCSTWGLAALLATGARPELMEVPTLLLVGAGLQAILDQ